MEKKRFGDNFGNAIISFLTEQYKGFIVALYVIPIFLGLFIGWEFFGFGIGLFWGIIAFLVGNIVCGFYITIIKISEDISKIKGIMSKDPEMMTPEEIKISNDEKTLKQGGWECSRCGRINPAYTGTCACGNRKSS